MWDTDEERFPWTGAAAHPQSRPGASTGGISVDTVGGRIAWSRQNQDVREQVDSGNRDILARTQVPRSELKWVSIHAIPPIISFFCSNRGPIFIPEFVPSLHVLPLADGFDISEALAVALRISTMGSHSTDPFVPPHDA